jgi:hypothetical protein
MGTKTKKVLFTIFAFIVIGLISAIFSNVLFKKNDIANAQCVPGLSRIACYTIAFQSGDAAPGRVASAQCRVGEFVGGFTPGGVSIGNRVYNGSITCCQAY